MRPAYPPSNYAAYTPPPYYAPGAPPSWRPPYYAPPVYQGPRPGWGYAPRAYWRGGWRGIVDRATIGLPAAGRHVEHTIASTIAYILINRDGPALQPGSRSYQRSWIRDGALTGAALLRFGHAGVVREFILWFAGFQYPSGKIPCCVDRRGPDA